MYGQPSRDPLIVQDEMHRNMMERGSERLWQRILAYRGGKPMPANDTFDFALPRQVGQKFRPIHEADVAHLIADRAPCARCGVRQDRQRRMFRIATDPRRYGLTLKMIAADSGLHPDSIRKYAAGETVLSMTSMVCLIGVLPDELLSLLLPEDRVIRTVGDDDDHARHARHCVEYLSDYAAARDPNSECQEKIGPGEHKRLKARRAAA